MALPSRMYGDPAKVAEYNEFITFGCGACKCHQIKKNKSGFECIMKQSDYPMANNKSCRFFRRKNEAHRKG